ncbi:sigma factor-like helix-turn-helix DNA-binding protein, partial [Salmonella enterica]|uniref:sigma factor-like helix-turn-helix DNA-binding protein n=1 Tax=Salmonella enterica TaxID=28901 RepID=UPI0032B45DF9
EAFRRCLPHLPEIQREALMLRLLQDLEWRDIGALVGTTAEAARTRCRTAVARLRGCMGLEPA